MVVIVRTLFLEVVVALEAATEAINGLAGLADPESDGVNCLAQGPHLPLITISVSLKIGFRVFEKSTLKNQSGGFSPK